MTPSTEGPASTALLTDLYELTMLSAALRAGTAGRRTTFEVFARRLPEGRRYGVVAGTGRLLEAVGDFVFDAVALEFLEGVVDPGTLDYLRGFRFGGDIDGFAEGELYFPGSPVLSVTGTFAECVVLETLVLSVLNHDSAVASAAARMVSAANGRPLIEMGSRRTHERAAVDAARAAYLAGFTATSNLLAGQRYGIPVQGTAAHAFTMLHTTAAGPDEAAAFRAQVEGLGADTTLLVDTYDVPTGVATAVEVAGRGLGAVRVDSGDPREVAAQVRRQLDALGAHRTRIVVSGDLDEYVIEALRSAPVDSFGVGTSVVTGSGAPTASMVYKLTEVDGVPVAKRSSHKQTRGGRKVAVREVGPSGTLLGETVLPAGAAPPAGSVPVTVALMRSGRPVSDDGLAQARRRVAAGLASLPADALDLAPGPPAFGMLVPSPR